MSHEDKGKKKDEEATDKDKKDKKIDIPLSTETPIEHAPPEKKVEAVVATPTKDGVQLTRTEKDAKSSELPTKKDDFGAPKAESGANVPESSPWTIISGAIEKMVTRTKTEAINEGGPDMTSVKLVATEWHTTVWKDTAVSLMKYIESPDMKWIKWDFTKKIDSFNLPHEYTFARWKLNLELLKYYDGVFRGMSEEELPIFGTTRTTRESELGFPGYTFIRNRPTDRYRHLIGTLKSLGNSDVPSANPNENLNKKMVVICGHPDEIAIQNMFHEIGQRRFVSVDFMYSWYEQLNDRFHYFIPPTLSVDRRFARCIRPGPFAAYYNFIDLNRFSRSMIFDAHRDIIWQKLDIKFKERNETINNLVRKFEIKTNQPSPIGTLGEVLQSSAAEQLYKNIVVMMLMGAYAKLSLPVDPTAPFNAYALLSCIAVKLMTPIQIWDKYTIFDVDNIIAKHLLPRMPGFNKAAYAYDDLQAKVRAVNYLTRNRRNGVLADGPLAAFFWDLFYTTNDGHGWGGTEQGNLAPMPANSGDFLGRGDIFFAYYAGAKVDDPERYPTMQMTRFMAFQTALETYTNPLIYGRMDRTEWDMVVRTLRMFRDRWVPMSYMAMQIDAACSKLAMMSTVRPTRPTYQDVIPTNTYSITVLANAPLSLFLLGEFTNRTPVALETTYIRWSWGLHEFFNEFVEGWHLVNAWFGTQTNKVWWTRAKRMPIALGLIRHDPGFKARFIQYAEDHINLDAMLFPDLNIIEPRFREFSEKLGVINNFVLKHKNQFGFSDYVMLGKVYDPNPPIRFMRDFRASKGVPILQTYTRTQFDEASQQLGLGVGLQALLTEGKKVVKFDLPIKVEYAEATGEIAQPPAITWDTKEPPKVHKLVYYYTWGDRIDLRLDNKVAMSELPKWLLTDIPLIDAEEPFIIKMFGYAECYKKQFELFDGFVAMPRPF